MGNVMIIDDSPIDRKLIRGILETNLKPDVNLYEADNGQDIINKIIASNIEVCILDIMMPLKNGLEVLKDIKENIILKDLPVIVYTALNDEVTIKQALDNGAHDYFKKPLSKEDMRVSLPLKVRNAIEFTKRKEEITYLSYHDKLTGLYNRRYFEEEVAKLMMEENLPISFIVGDVNRLKLANDTFGHAFGDRLLVKIVSIIKEESREGYIIARIGGDEFVIVMPKTNRTEAKDFIQRINDSCEREQGNLIKPSISLGYSVMERMGLELSELYKEAEDRMYQSKILYGQSYRSSIEPALKYSINSQDSDSDNQRMEQLSQDVIRTFHLTEELLNSLICKCNSRGMKCKEDIIRYLTEQSGKRLDPKLVELICLNMSDA